MLKKMVRFALSFSLVTATLSLASCSKVLYAPMYQTGTISHVVVVTLKNHGSQADRMKLIDAARELRKISGVFDVEVGTVLPSDRPVVVSDYDVAMVVTFRDESYMKKYLNDPIHLRLVKEVLDPIADPSKTRVYDFVNHE
jgi:type III secretory pathway lipoprotein EscJ